MNDRDFWDDVVSFLIAATVSVMFLTLVCGCKGKQRAVEASVSVIVDTSAVERDSVRHVEQRHDSMHITMLQEVWENISFTDSLGEIQVQTDGTVIMRGVQSLQRENTGAHSIRAGTTIATDSMAVHGRSYNGTTSRDSTSKAGVALTKKDQRYITIGKYATGVIIALVIGAVIALSIWWFGRKIP